MDRVYGAIVGVSKWLTVVAAAALTFMMLLTVADVVGRAAGHAVLGTYEIVSTLLGVVIGFCLPKVTIDRGHVSMEFVLEKVSSRAPRHHEHDDQADMPDPLYAYRVQPCLGR